MKNVRLSAAAAIISVFGPTLATPDNSQYAGWQQPRGGVVNDTFFLEGGLIHATNGSIRRRPNGNFFELRFCETFDTSTDGFDQILHQLNETLNGDAPTMIDGYLFADNDEFYTYGGMQYPTAQDRPPTIFHAGLNQPNPAATLWVPSLDTNFPLEGVTNYITNGAGVSIPSESLGFYFGGMRSASGGNISYVASEGVDAPDTLTKTLIEVDMKTYETPKWTLQDLPNDVAARAEASLVWIPVAKQGLLIAIGGVVEPADLFAYSLNDTQLAESRSQSPTFMTDLPVYDIYGKTWYQQKTSGNPPTQLAQFCTIVTSAQDDSSYQIYVYGGWDGLGLGQEASDEVWILSVPSFKWIKVSGGSAGHGRRTHVCTSPAPNQMITIGGVDENGGSLKSAPIDVFDLNSLAWTGKYDPKLGGEYKVPDAVTKAIRASDGSTIFATDMDTNLATLFRTPYSGEIVRAWPYTPCGETQSKPNSTPTWHYAVIGTVVGVAVVAFALLACWCCRRRRKTRRHSITTSDSARNHGIISRWIHGTPAHTEYAPKSYHSETTTEVGDVMSPTIAHEADGYFKPRAELAENQVSIASRVKSQPYATARPPMTPQSGSAEVEAATRYELPGQHSFSIRDHPMYPPSLGNHPRSVLSDTMSTPSEAPSTSHMSPQRSDFGPISPSQLSQAQTDGAISPELESGFNLDTQTTEHQGKNEYTPAVVSPLARSVSSPIRGAEFSPVSPTGRPIHHRNTSSMSSGMAQLPSPASTDDKRQSDYITALPAHHNPAETPRQRLTPSDLHRHPEESIATRFQDRPKTADEEDKAQQEWSTF